MKNPIRKLYDWTLSFAYTKYGTLALNIVAFAESSFFPVAPDTLLIPLALSRPKKAFYYASLCTAFSVLGGVAGYIIGAFLMEKVGIPILKLYKLLDKFNTVAEYYRRYDFIAVGIAGFTPLPYKIFTIGAGACKINILNFIIASIVSRGARFFIVSSLLYTLGEPVKTFIDRYFNLLTLIFVILLVFGFIAIKALL